MKFAYDIFNVLQLSLESYVERDVFIQKVETYEKSETIVFDNKDRGETRLKNRFLKVCRDGVGRIQL